MTKKSLLKKIYPVIGTLFLIVGAVMVITAATIWHNSESLPWQVIAFALMNLIAAYGFYVRGRWLLPVFATAACAVLILTSVFLVRYGADGLIVPSLIKLAVFGGILWFIYSTRTQLHLRAHDSYIAAFFVLLLVAATSYTALIALS